MYWHQEQLCIVMNSELMCELGKKYGISGNTSPFLMQQFFFVVVVVVSISLTELKQCNFVDDDHHKHIL